MPKKKQRLPFSAERHPKATGRVTNFPMAAPFRVPSRLTVPLESSDEDMQQRMRGAFLRGKGMIGIGERKIPKKIPRGTSAIDHFLRRRTGPSLFGR